MKLILVVIPLILGVSLVLGLAVGFQAVKTSLIVVKQFSAKASLLEARVCLCRPREDVKLERDDGLMIAGSLYGFDSDRPGPTILLLHGHTPYGRQLPLYRVLATKLVNIGYRVKVIDFTGFGESGDPYSLGTLAALDRSSDVEAALRFLKTRKEVDQEQIYIVAHSMGSTTGLDVTLHNPGVKKMVAIGPPRRIEERARDPKDVQYWWERGNHTHKQVYGYEFPQWYTRDLFITPSSAVTPLGNYINDLSQEGHKPILLIDGQLESEADRIYLKEFYEAISEPKGYATIPSSDHYANTRSLPGRLHRLALFDSRAVSQHVKAINRFLANAEDLR